MSLCQMFHLIDPQADFLKILQTFKTLSDYNMPEVRKTLAEQQVEEDPRIDSGDVYLSPQIIQHDDGSHEPMSNAGKELAHTMAKTPSYKAKLIFQGSKEPIGDFKTEETRVTCRTHMDEQEQCSILDLNASRDLLEATQGFNNVRSDMLDGRRLIHNRKWNPLADTWNGRMTSPPD